MCERRELRLVVSRLAVLIFPVTTSETDEEN